MGWSDQSVSGKLRGVKRERTRLLVAVAAALVGACGGGEPGAPPRGPAFTVVTFNTGTNPGLPHDDPPDDGYGSQQADYSDQYYGDGLAWLPVIESTRLFLAMVAPELIGFQEIFYSGDCPMVPAEARPGFVCEGWSDGDPTVAQLLLGAGYQVACHPGHADKCVAVRRAFGSFRGCAGDLCLDAMDGFELDGCGGGARVARVVVDLAGGGELTLVNVHGTSGFTDEDHGCRVRQVEQVFVDLGDGAPGASGEHNLVIGDLNTDPGRLAAADASAARWNDFAGPPGGGRAFTFISAVGADAEPSYSGLFNIDHVIGDTAQGACWVAGVSAGRPPVTEAVFFDHHPVVCTVTLPAREE